MKPAIVAASCGQKEGQKGTELRRSSFGLASRAGSYAALEPDRTLASRHLFTPDSALSFDGMRRGVVIFLGMLVLAAVVGVGAYDYTRLHQKADDLHQKAADWRFGSCQGMGLQPEGCQDYWNGQAKPYEDRANRRLILYGAGAAVVVLLTGGPAALARPRTPREA
jgi:hypothetical protein